MLEVVDELIILEAKDVTHRDPTRASSRDGVDEELT